MRELRSTGQDAEHRLLDEVGNHGAEAFAPLETRELFLHLPFVEKGREGITQAGNRRFRLAIIDLFLSDISGLRAIKTIREQQPEILIIMITGRGNPQAFSVARRLGVVGILAKPFRPADILQLITTNLAR